MAEEKKLNMEELDAVAGGMGDVNLEGATTGGNMTVADQHTETNVENYNVGGDYTVGDKVGGDVVGGNKSDVEVTTDIKVEVDVEKSLF